MQAGSQLNDILKYKMGIDCTVLIRSGAYIRGFTAFDSEISSHIELLLFARTEVTTVGKWYVK